MGICPLIFYSTCDVNRSWCDKTNEHMLIEREVFLIVTVLVEVVIEPMRKGSVYGTHGFSEFPFRQSCTSTTRIVGNHTCKSLILSTCPQRSLAESGMTKYDH